MDGMRRKERGNPVSFEGKKYASLNSLARSLGLSEYALRSQYNKIKNIEAAVKKCRSLQDKHPKLWGRSYSSITEVAASFGISSHLLYYRIETGAELNEAVLQILKEEPIQFRGKEYASMSDLCAEFKIQPQLHRVG